MARTALILLGLWGCEGDKEPTDTQATYDAPTLSHTAPTDALTEGDTLLLEVSASDPDGIAEVVLYWRTEGDSTFDSAPMSQGEGESWSVIVSGLESPGLEYFFRATDGGSPQLSSRLPDDGEDNPYALDVNVDALPLPYAEDFELAEGELNLLDLGWWAPSLAFPAYSWDIAEPGYDSETAAVHLRGVEDASAMDDWLISPALDFTTLDSAMVTWVELGNAAELGTHGLYLSTTSRDPESGTFVPVVEALPPAVEDQWARSAAVDLSAWAGEPVVYLAWRYEGEYADDWSVDDVSVRALAADLDASVDWSPDPVHPGETTTVTVTLTNLVDIPASGLSATLSLPEGGGALASDTVEVGDIDALGSAEASFELTIDEDLTDNRALPLALQVENDTELWTFDDLEMIVGEPSTLDLTLVLYDDASVSAVVGVGDPDAPDFSFTLYSGDLVTGSNTVSADITDLYALLPPAAGELRWFASVTSSAEGRVDDFIITYGGESYEATTLPPLDADEVAITWLPEPPAPEIVEQSTSVEPVAPGDGGVQISLLLENDGADTQGPVTATVTALDDTISLYGGEPFLLDADIWEDNEEILLESLTFDVSTAHDDSRPARFEMLLDDGVESWTLEFQVDVPWPVLRIIEVEIDDDDRDGLLEAGEEADLTIHVANTGDLDTFDALSATLTLAETSTADVTLTSTAAEYSAITADSSRDEDFALEVNDGAAGDVIDIELLLDDGMASYVATTRLTLGEPPWTALSSAEDPIEDPVGGDFDLVWGEWRAHEGQLQLRLYSETAFDPDDVFIEIWGQSTGADYLYYKFLYQYGVGYTMGYNSGDGFGTIGGLELTVESETSALLVWEIEDMGLLLDELEIGVSAGWCGPPDYYCDQYPDGWGWPYESFSTADWFGMKW